MIMAQESFFILPPPMVVNETPLNLEVMNCHVSYVRRSEIGCPRSKEPFILGMHCALAARRGLLGAISTILLLRSLPLRSKILSRPAENPPTCFFVCVLIQMWSTEN